jgi:ribosomal protein S18 acetylase RimI-like enzyme
MIRQAKQTDRQRLKEIIDISFPKFFRFFANHSIDSKNGIVLVTEKEGVTAGFAKLTQFTIADENFGCILWLAAHPDFRSKGVATALVKAGRDLLGQQGAKAVFASTQRSNAGSLATFDGAGFHRTGFFFGVVDGFWLAYF